MQTELIKYIEQYKKIIRAYYGRKKAKEANAYIYRMKITRKQLAQCDSVKLNKVCRIIVCDAKDFLRKRRIDLSCRFKNSRLKGLELLINNLEKELEIGIVVDYIKDAPNARGREVWRGIINLIQLITLPDYKFNGDKLSLLINCVKSIALKCNADEFEYCLNLLNNYHYPRHREVLKEVWNART